MYHDTALVRVPAVVPDEERIYTFDELDEKAKARAIERCREDPDYLDYGWWRDCYDMFLDVADALGIDIDRRTGKTPDGRTYSDPAIYFSGFWSQGDGACFTGLWSPGADHDEAYSRFCNIVDEYPQATDLHDIAFSLAEIRMMNPHAEFRAKITHSGSYYHAYSTTSMLDFWPPEFDGTRQLVYQTLYPDDRFDDIDYATQETLRRLMNWMYQVLEDEYETLNSDESIADYIRGNEIEFEADGTAI